MSNQNGDKPTHDEVPEDEPRAPQRPDPRFIEARRGTRLVSLGALLERIERQFSEEYGDDSPALREADTRTRRLGLILPVVEYVLAVESVLVTNEEKADLVERAYANLFSYGPLDALFDDERVTTIVLDGGDKAAVRYGHGELVSLAPLFEDNDHMARIITRMVMHAGADLRADAPYLEVGLTIAGRPLCLNLVLPPAALHIHADIRVHPRSAPLLGDLAAAGILTTRAGEALAALAASPHGLVVVGDVESGKTTLLGALAYLLPDPAAAVAVERAGELRLPPDVRRLVVRWPVGEDPGAAFGDQIGAALDLKPACLLLDEVRADAPEAIAPLLTLPDPPRQWWTFRGAADAKRLQSALGMLARRADMQQSEAMVQALYRRLPFVVTVRRFQGRLQVYSLGEWQFRDSADYPDYVVLMQLEDGLLRTTGRRPARDLPLDARFWEAEAG